MLLLVLEEAFSKNLVNSLVLYQVVSKSHGVQYWLLAQSFPFKWLRALPTKCARETSVKVPLHYSPATLKTIAETGPAVSRVSPVENNPRGDRGREGGLWRH